MLVPHTCELNDFSARVQIDTLLKEPGRSQRPSQIIVLLRGLPGTHGLCPTPCLSNVSPLGSGKSYVAELIKVSTSNG